LTTDRAGGTSNGVLLRPSRPLLATIALLAIGASTPTPAHAAVLAKRAPSPCSLFSRAQLRVVMHRTLAHRQLVGHTCWWTDRPAPQARDAVIVAVLPPVRARQRFATWLLRAEQGSPLARLAPEVGAGRNAIYYPVRGELNVRARGLVVQFSALVRNRPDRGLAVKLARRWLRS
jgi:hypothetical protein